jgi:hypothetical protein
MSTDLIKEEDGKGYSLTRFCGKKGTMYQITQNYDKQETEPGQLYLRSIIGYVCVSKEDLIDMVNAILDEQEKFLKVGLEVLKNHSQKG